PVAGRGCVSDTPVDTVDGTCGCIRSRRRRGDRRDLLACRVDLDRGVVDDIGGQWHGDRDPPARGSCLPVSCRGLLLDRERTRLLGGAGEDRVRATVVPDAEAAVTGFGRTEPGHGPGWDALVPEGASALDR